MDHTIEKICPFKITFAAIFAFICLLIIIANSGCGKAPAKPDPSDPTERALALHSEAAARLMASHVRQGFVVTLKGGQPEHVGEGILWAGVAMASLGCQDAAAVAHDLAGWIVKGGGWIRRYEPLPDEYKGKELNFDGESGLEAGVAGFAFRCPAQADEISLAWAAHQKAMDSAAGLVYPGTGSTMTVFAFTATALSHALNGGAAPSPGSQAAMEQGAAGMALAVKLTHGPAYRMHLAFRHLRAAEQMGYSISQNGRNEFCSNTLGANIPTIDEWCGRGGLTQWIDAFVWNQWEYRFQRSGAWESADGDGMTTPAVDLIEAIRQAYRLEP